MPDKEFLSAVAITLTFVGLYPYLRGIIQGRVKPHVFSWVIWGSTTSVVFLAQLQAGGGAGAWPIGGSGAITLLIAVLAYVGEARPLAATREVAMQWEGTLTFYFEGWDDDPRETAEIPEIRAYFQALTEAWPYWLHFIEKVGDTFGHVLRLLSDFTPADRPIFRR